MKREDVAGGAGVKLATYECGEPEGRAILFIHGIAQSHLCWTRQFGSYLKERFRLVAFDSRGHGASEKPVGAEYYASSDMWADDVAAVIDQKDLDKPVVGQAVLYHTVYKALVLWAGLKVVRYIGEGNFDGLGIAAPHAND